MSTRPRPPAYRRLDAGPRAMLEEGFVWLRIGYPETPRALRAIDETAEERTRDGGIRKIAGLIGRTWDSYVEVLRERGLAELRLHEDELNRALVRMDERATLDPNPEPDPITPQQLAVTRSAIAFRLSILRNVLLQAAAFGDIETWAGLWGDDRAALTNIPLGRAFEGRAADYLRAWGRIRRRFVDRPDSDKEVVLGEIGRAAPARADAHTGHHEVRDRLENAGLQIARGTTEEMMEALDAAWRDLVLHELVLGADRPTEAD